MTQSDFQRADPGSQWRTDCRGQCGSWEPRGEAPGRGGGRAHGEKCIVMKEREASWRPAPVKVRGEGWR